MGTVIHYQQRGNPKRTQRWDRIESAAFFAWYSDLQAQGTSQRQAAKVFEVPRTTLQAWCGHIKGALMPVPLSRRFFTVFLVSPSCIAWCWRDTWWVSRLVPVGFDGVSRVRADGS